MIYLDTLKPKDVNGFYTWITDYEVTKYSLTLFQKLKIKGNIDTWYTELLEDIKNVNFGLYLTENNACIGYAGLTNISQTNKSAEFFIFIGDKTQWGKGYGTIVTNKVVDYGFNELSLNRIMLTVSEPNIGGYNAYKKAGFIYEGKLREACFRDGKYHDKIIMSILKSEYKK